MRAIRNGLPEVEVVDVDEPDGDGALIRVAAAGICASDLQYLQWGSREIAGHEFAGVLDDGTAVAVEAIFGCQGCPQCDRGNFNLCASGPTALGMTSSGGMSEYYRAPRHALIPLPPGLDLKDASLVEPASVALHGCHQGSIGSDTSVAVVGGGAIGMLPPLQHRTWASTRLPSRCIIPTNSMPAISLALSPPRASTTWSSRREEARARCTAPWSWHDREAPWFTWECSMTSHGLAGSPS